MDALLAGDEPAEEVASCIWRLGKAGYSKDELVDGIKMLGKLPWSQVSTEQGHSAASVVMKRHRMLGQEMMQCRSLLSQMRCLFAELPEVRKLNHLRSSLVRLQARRGSIGGRQTYVQELLEVARGLRHTGQDSCHELHIAQEVFARHGVRWKAMTREQQTAYEMRGRIRTGEAQEQQCQHFTETKEAYKHQLRTAKQAAEDEKMGPLRVGSCRMIAAEILAFDGMWSDPRFGGKAVQAQCRVAQDLVQPLPKAAQEALLVFPELAARTTVPTPSWIKVMCKHRSFFKSTIVQLRCQDEVRFLITLLLQMFPYRAAFLEILPFEVLDEFKQAEYLHAGKATLFSTTFVALSGAFLWSHVDKVFAADCEVLFMRDVCFYDDELVGSHDEWHTLAELRGLLRDMESDARPDTGSRSSQRLPDNALYVENPWLQDVLGGPTSSAPATFVTRPSERPSASQSGGQSSTDPQTSTQEFSMDQVVTELQRQRDLFMADLPDQPVQHFKTTLRGGAWTAAHVGAVADFRSRLCCHFRGQAVLH